MNKLFYVLGLSVALAVTSVQANVAVVNVADIFQKMPEREKVSKQLENEFKSRLTELQKLEKDLQSSMEKLQKDGPTMKAADRTKLEQSTIAKRDDFTAKAEAFEQDNRRRQGEERTKMLAKIQKAVQEIAKKEKYTVVIDVNATAFADPSVDITEAVLKQVK